jgi:hypothetical protein
MARVVGAALLLALVVASGCSGKTETDDDDSASGGTSSKPKPEPSPVVQCKNYVSTWCNKGFGCSVQVGRSAQASLKANVDQCVSVIVNKLPCSAVMSVSDQYDKCISQIKAMPCSKWDVPQAQISSIPAPASCSEALSF